MATSHPGGRGRNGDREHKSLDQALNSSKPVFPYPPTLPDDLKPLWLMTVNSKTADYWSDTDIPLLEMYCRCIADIRRLTKEIEDEGEVIFNANHNPVINPKLTVRAFSENRFMALCTKTRLQPLARTDTADSPAKGKQKKAAAKAAGVIDSDPDDLLGGDVRGVMQ